MKRFKCTVERTDEYIIEIDENKINREWIEEFKKHFYDFDTLEEHAGYIAQYRARFESNFIEGYGVPLINGKKPPLLSPNEFESGINVIIISEDYNGNVDVEEIK